jgi:hypothetical protein
MFSRAKNQTISLPLYNVPRHSQRPRLGQRNMTTRCMALGLINFLALVILFAFSRASALIKNHSQRDLIIRNAVAFQTNIEAITEIYRGNDAQQEQINHLIIVTGHAILLDKFNYMNDEGWLLEPFQKGGQTQTFVEHVLKGIELAKNDNRSLLVFSGYAIEKLFSS